MPRPRLGLFLSAQHPPETPPAEGLAVDLELVRLARRLGFATLMTGQHFLTTSTAKIQTVPLLARLSAEAEGMTLATGVLLLGLLNPVEAAEHLAALSVLSGGRLVAGVGLGYRSEEHRAFGAPDRGRAAVFEAKLDVVRRLLAGERVTASGPGYDLDGARLELRLDVPPPIWMAANRDAAVTRAARLADAWLINPHGRISELAAQTELFHATRAEEGRTPVPGLPIIREVCVAPTDEEAGELAARHLAAKYATYVKWGQDTALPDTDTLQRPWRSLNADGRFVVGSPDTCARQITELVDRLGVSDLICRVHWPGMPAEHALRSLELLVRAVSAA